MAAELRCDRYIGAPVDGEYPWPIEEHRCILPRDHDGQHLLCDEDEQ